MKLPWIEVEIFLAVICIDCIEKGESNYPKIVEIEAILNWIMSVYKYILPQYFSHISQLFWWNKQENEEKPDLQLQLVIVMYQIHVHLALFI